MKRAYLFFMLLCCVPLLGSSPASQPTTRSALTYSDVFMPQKHIFKMKGARHIEDVINLAGAMANASGNQELIRAVNLVQSRWYGARILRYDMTKQEFKVTEGPGKFVLGKSIIIVWAKKKDVKKLASTSLFHRMRRISVAFFMKMRNAMTVVLMPKRGLSKKFIVLTALHEFIHLYRYYTKKDVTLKVKKGVSPKQSAFQRAYEEAYTVNAVAKALETYGGKRYRRIMRHMWKKFMEQYANLRPKKKHLDDHLFFHHLSLNLLRWNARNNYYFIWAVMSDVKKLFGDKKMFKEYAYAVYVSFVSYAYRRHKTYKGKGFKSPHGVYIKPMLAFANFVYSSKMFH